MRNLVIGNLPQNRRSLNLGEYAEDATLVENSLTIAPLRSL